MGGGVAETLLHDFWNNKCLNMREFAKLSPDTNGQFFANFTVPSSTLVRPVPVVATQGENLASSTFEVTLASSSILASTTRSNGTSFGDPINESNQNRKRLSCHAKLQLNDWRK